MFSFQAIDDSPKFTVKLVKSGLDPKIVQAEINESKSKLLNLLLLGDMSIALKIILYIFLGLVALVCAIGCCLSAMTTITCFGLVKATGQVFPR